MVLLSQPKRSGKDKLHGNFRICPAGDFFPLLVLIVP